MITHALLRNTLFPILFLAYYCNHRKNGKYDSYYWGLYVLSLVAMCIYFVFAVIGYNPLNQLIPSTWRDPYSPLQYLVYITIVARIAEHRTHDIGYAYTVAATSAGAAGYLYEIPRWLQWGWVHVFRTAKTSIIILDWGMLCVPLLIYLVGSRKVNLFDTRLLLSMSLYALYCIAYYHNSARLIQVTNSLFLPIPKTVIFRIPALLLCGYFVNTLRNSVE